jgi:hypothetical protein
MTGIINPNVQPIFIRRPNFWSGAIQNETVPGAMVGAATPKKIGTAGKNGSLIEELYVLRTGNHVASFVWFFLKGPEIGLDYTVCGGQQMLAESSYVVDEPNAFSVLLWKLLSPASCDGSSPHKGLRLPPESELYVGLSVAVASPFVVVATGGDY